MVVLLVDLLQELDQSFGNHLRIPIVFVTNHLVLLLFNLGPLSVLFGLNTQTTLHQGPIPFFFASTDAVPVLVGSVRNLITREDVYNRIHILLMISAVKLIVRLFTLLKQS